MSAASDTARNVKRWTLVAIAVLGIGLCAAPAIFGMFSRAPKGAQMMQAFKPYMTDSRLNAFQREIRQIDDGVHEADTSVAVALTGPGAAAHRRFDKRYPDFASFQGQWGPIHTDFKSLMDKIQANAGNYRAMVALPSFNLFPWFFVIPGALLALLALAGLARASLRPRVSWAVAAIGVALLIAPVAIGLFSAGPKGGAMMSAFRKIETRKRVVTMQGYFGTVAVGQGSLRLALVPALQRSGLSDAQIAARFPDVTTLDAKWVSILNDLTPMIGVMSDNVDNYQAISSLPPFALFPWFFVAPGLIALGLALGGPGRRRLRFLPSTSAPQGTTI